MASRAALMRQQQILQLLTDNEGGASYVAKNLDIPYVTCRRLLSELEEQGKIEVVNYSHGKGGYVYRTKTNDPMPYLTSFGENYPAITYLSAMADRARSNGGRFTSEGVSDAVHHVALGLATILYNAHLVAEQGSIDERAMRDTRQAVNKAEKVFAEMAKLCRQILDNPVFWDEDKLKFITRSDMWVTRQVIQNFEILTTKDSADLANLNEVANLQNTVGY